MATSWYHGMNYHSIRFNQQMNMAKLFACSEAVVHGVAGQVMPLRTSADHDHDGHHSANADWSLRGWRYCPHWWCTLWRSIRCHAWLILYVIPCLEHKYDCYLHTFCIKIFLKKVRSLQPLQAYLRDYLGAIYPLTLKNLSVGSWLNLQVLQNLGYFLFQIIPQVECCCRSRGSHSFPFQRLKPFTYAASTEVLYAQRLMIFLLA